MGWLQSKFGAVMFFTFFTPLMEMWSEAVGKWWAQGVVLGGQIEGMLRWCCSVVGLGMRFMIYAAEVEAW